MFFKKIKDFINALKTPDIEPRNFQDPIANQTQWSPLYGGGSNFQTKKIKIISDQRIQFVPTTGMILFGGIFLIMGICAATLFPLLSMDQMQGFELYIPVIVGGLFTSIGGGLIYTSTMPVVFDKSQGYFWKSRKEPRELYNLQQEGKNHIPLRDIYAIQVIPERISSKNGSYYSYEMNLILKDASRVNVIDYGNLSKIRHSAETVSTFLDVPVWDITLKSFDW